MKNMGVLNLKKLGGQIRKIRIEQGLFQKTVSRKAGIGNSFYSQLECGNRIVSLQTLGRIAKALKVSLSDFFPKEKRRS